MKWLAIGAAVLLIGTASGSAQPPPPFAPIPPPRQEFVPPHPGGRLVWQPGHWRWNGFRYVWIGGAYVERRPHYGHYIEGSWLWVPREGRWIWRPAHWE